MLPQNNPNLDLPGGAFLGQSNTRFAKVVHSTQTCAASPGGGQSRFGLGGSLGLSSGLSLGLSLGGGGGGSVLVATPV